MAAAALPFAHAHGAAAAAQAWMGKAMTSSTARENRLNRFMAAMLSPLPWRGNGARRAGGARQKTKNRPQVDALTAVRAGMANPSPQPVPTDTSREGVGAQIGRFTILRQLGRGSEGVVYLARDPELDRDVAIKTRSPDQAPNRQIAELLVNTARTASTLSHPNIVPVFEAGMHQGTPYVVYEYVPGPTLARLLASRGPLPMARAVIVMSQVLAGVALIHSRGLLHGDIKPGNILVGTDGRARLADFGLMRDANAQHVRPTSGTLRYMSPECLDGSPVDCRRDIYALGLVLVETLTGKAVVPDGQRAEVIEIIRNQAPARPSELNPRVPAMIDAIALKALQKAPSERYSDAAEMKRDLDRIRVPVNGDGSVELRESANHSTVEFLLRRMAHQSDFGALSVSLAGINRIGSAGEDVSFIQFAELVMRDFALTQKLLRVVNGASVGAGKITRVSDAIAVLGLTQVRALTVGMALAGGAGKSPAVAAALTEAFVAGVIARNLGRALRVASAEELFICGMFTALGDLLALHYLPEEHAEILRRIVHEDTNAVAAARSVLGIGLGELGDAVARHWQFPMEIVNALSPPPEGVLAAATDIPGRMQHCTAYARELCGLARAASADQCEAAFTAHVARFAQSVPVRPQAMRELLARSVELARGYAAGAGLPVAETPMLAGMRQLAGVSPVAEPAPAPAPASGESAAAAPEAPAAAQGDPAASGESRSSWLTRLRQVVTRRS